MCESFVIFLQLVSIHWFKRKRCYTSPDVIPIVFLYYIGERIGIGETISTNKKNENRNRVGGKMRSGRQMAVCDRNE